MSSETARQDASVSGGAHTKRVSPRLTERERRILVYQLERERHQTWVNILKACEIEAKRQVLSILLINDGVCMYEDLFSSIPRNERTIKKHIYKLDSWNIIERSGNPTFVSFVDTDISLLVSDALSTTDEL